jgi:hypothetical protein
MPLDVRLAQGLPIGTCAAAINAHGNTAPNRNPVSSFEVSVVPIGDYAQETVFRHFQRSGVHCPSWLMDVAGRFVSSCIRYCCGSTRCRRHVPLRLERIAAVWPPCSLPTNRELLRLKTIRFIWRLEMLLPIGREGFSANVIRGFSAFRFRCLRARLIRTCSIRSKRPGMNLICQLDSSPIFSRFVPRRRHAVALPYIYYNLCRFTGRFA